MIRVLLVPSSDYIGHPFPQRHNQIFERLNDKKNFEVHVVRFHLFEKIRLNTGLVVHDLEDRRARSAAFYYLLNAVGHASQIRRIIRKESIDVVVLSNLAAPLAFTLMDVISSVGVPIVFDVPDYYPTSAAGYMFDVKSLQGKLVSGVFDVGLRQMMRHANLVTVVSCALENYAKHAGASWVEHVPNGIAECFLTLHKGDRLRAKLGYCKSDFVVGYVGSVEFWLDMHALIRGIALARKKGLAAKLLIIGRGLHTDYLERIEKMLKIEGIANNTVWLDFIPHEEVPGYMSAVDVGTIPFDVRNPTAYFSAPNKMWEYLSQKRSVIATPIPEVLRNSDCVYSVSTPEDYADRLFALYRGKTRINEKVQVGYEKALSNTWAKSASLMADAISKLTNKDLN